MIRNDFITWTGPVELKKLKIVTIIQFYQSDRDGKIMYIKYKTGFNIKPK